MTSTRTTTHTHTFTGLDLVKPLVKSILEHAEAYEWTLQGFGMLRTYLAPELRLHVWDSTFRVEDVSSMHTHPWNFHSYVVAGNVKNVRYEKLGEGSRATGKPYREQEILCGEGGHETSRSSMVRLFEHRPEIVGAGQSYSQLAHEIHSSDPDDGTVTIIAREFLDDADHAFVYIPEDGEWVSAEPRAATTIEVAQICRNALRTWF